MTYQTIKDLPETLQTLLPNKDAQQLYLEAFNNTWNQFDENASLGEQTRESAAHRDGWTAVKQEYSQDSEGNWYPKGEELDEEEQEENLLDKVKDIVA